MEGNLLTTQKLIGIFLEEYKSNLSKHTLRSYKYALESFFNNKKEYNEVKPRDIRAWIKVLTEKGQKPSTIESRIYAIRKFYNFCVEDNYIKSNPTDNITIPKIDERSPFYLDKEQLLKLKEIVKDSPRDRAIIEVLYATGMRVSELANIKIEDVNFDSRLLHIKKGKGNKDRIVPFTIECGERIKEYLLERYDEYPNLFLNDINTPIRAQVVRRKFEKYSKKLGIRVTPHTMRHTLAAHLAEKGMPISCIQDLLAHDDINTTKIYTKLFSHVRKQKYDEFL